MYLVSKGPQQLGGLKKRLVCTNQTTANPCNTTGQGAGGDVSPQPSVPLLSPLPGQFLWVSAPSWCSVCFARSVSRARIRLLCTNIRQKAAFPQPLRGTTQTITQAAGVTHNEEHGEGKQISSKSLVNKRLMKSLLVLSLAALDKSLQTRKQK